MQVLVRDNNVEQALRVLKKKMQREGVFREMKRRRFYEKPSERTVRERARPYGAAASSLASRRYGRASLRRPGKDPPSQARRPSLAHASVYSGSFE